MGSVLTKADGKGRMSRATCIACAKGVQRFPLLHQRPRRHLQQQAQARRQQLRASLMDAVLAAGYDTMTPTTITTFATTSAQQRKLA